MTYPFRTDPYIIAEVGSCHDGSLSMALLIIEQIANAGADAVKFQVYDADCLSLRRNAQPFRDKYAQYQLPHAWLPELKKRAADHKLDFVLSVYGGFDLEAAAPYADILKVSSFESGDSRLIESCYATGNPVVVSTGLLSEIGMLELQHHINLSKLSNVWLLHCVSSYPTTMKDLNLSTIRRYRLDGFSDHSRNTLTGALAVSHGARILEVHVRAYSTKANSPDFPHSLDPGQLFEYVRNAQQSKLAIGTPRTGILPCEEMLARFKVKPQ